MMVLDTNVVSELMRGSPTPAVVRFVGRQAAMSLYTTAITEAEVLHGVRRLPSGRRRTALQRAAEAMFREDFAGRILPFGSDAARAYATIATDRRGRSRPISQFDAQIAAITAVAGATLVTRNVADFQECGIRVVDPWR